MAETIYSAVFIEEKELEGSSAFVVDGGYIAVVRFVSAFHGVQITPVRGRVTGPSNAAFFGFHDPVEAELPKSKYHAQNLRVVVDELQTITAHVDLGNADVYVGGYLLRKE